MVASAVMDGFPGWETEPSTTNESKEEERMTNLPVLCYVRDNWAWFTTLPLEDQWGDDWDDVPYQHNAGYPYSSNPNSWELTKIAWDGPFIEPSEWTKGISVRFINAGVVPWLRTVTYIEPIITIFAGITLFGFRKRIERAGGHIYLR